MLPDRVSNPGPLTYESGALPIALRGSAERERERERRKANSQICAQFFNYSQAYLRYKHEE